jgi:predicted secreted hydrolase
MDITGLFKIGDDIREVTGIAWFDHQWGDFQVNQLGWDWFALRLDDGTDVMLYNLFDASGLPVLGSGTLSRGGISKVLSTDDYKVTPTDSWISSKTGIEYPMDWLVEIPAQSMKLKVTPVIRESEFDGRPTAYVVYWEGPVEITGSHVGEGFAELSGYKAKQSRQAEAKSRAQQ